jgi:leucyl aminopeptidase
MWITAKQEAGARLLKVSMKIKFSKVECPEEGVLIVPVCEGADWPALLTELDAAADAILSRAAEAAEFTGKKGSTLDVYAPAGIPLNRVVLLGMGEAQPLAAKDVAALGGKVYAAIVGGKDKIATVLCDGVQLADTVPAGLAAAEMGLGAVLRSYRFEKYFTKKDADDAPTLKKLVIATADPAAAKTAFAAKEAVAEGVFLTRDLASEPANVLTPSAFAAECEKLAALGISVEVLGEKQLRKLGMGALIGVAQGSEQEPKVAIMRWHGAADKDAAPVAFVGKGVCFDSGGISLKPAANMDDMKWDMGGAGVVTGLMAALAKRKAQVNAVGIIGLVENMPSGRAQRPGDIVTSMSGQTIEVLNTDAEGRLVLADILTYVQKEDKPQAIIDLATLTGAVIIALGSHYAGILSNNDDLAAQITAAGAAVGEPVWRLPLAQSYDEQLKSDIADMKNIGGREAGTITAAQFLQRFIENDTPWVHIDIAGVTWASKGTDTVPKGASGFGVRLLDQFVADQFEAAVSESAAE